MFCRVGKLCFLAKDGRAVEIRLGLTKSLESLSLREYTTFFFKDFLTAGFGLSREERWIKSSCRTWPDDVVYDKCGYDSVAVRNN